MLCSQETLKSGNSSITTQKPLSDMREHIRNAQLLLAYASEAGINVEADIIQSVVEAKNTCESDITPSDPVAIEVKFWQATEKLAKSVNPVTVASLRASYDIQEDSSYIGLIRALILRSPQKISQAKLTVRRYRLLTLVTLVVLLTVQVYWVVGSSVTKEISSSIDQWMKDQDEKEKLETELTRSDTSLVPLPLEPQKALKRVDDKLKNHEKTSQLDADILEDWSLYWSRPLEFFLRIFRTEHDSPSFEPCTAYEKLLHASKKAHFALIGLQIYLLPILYGLLGSITYVLRSLGTQIKNVSYTAESDIGYRLRVILGALAGLSIAWFLQPGGENTEMKVFTTLSPFTVAFLAGYGIELFFSAMDRIIGAFSSATDAK